MGATGALESFQVDDWAMLQYPASPMADGAADVWLRHRDGQGIDPVSLCSQNSPLRPVRVGVGNQQRAHRRGRIGDLDVELRFAWAATEPYWCWHVLVHNAGAAPVELDLVHAHDVALAAPGAVRANEHYVSQYLDVTPVEVPEHGVALGVRQNMPGATPWMLLGCLTAADRWATDLVQLTGTGRLEGAPWPGLREDLPASRRQGEHTVAALQTRPVTLAPGERHRSGFYGVVVTDHPAATGPEDRIHAESAIEWVRRSSVERDAPPTVERSRDADFPPVERDALPPVERSRDADLPSVERDALPPVERSRDADPRSWLGTAERVRCRTASTSDLDRWTDEERIRPEYDGDTLLGYFTATGDHVVTAAKQARVLRPHGHLMRTGSALVPDERTVTTTAWMDGSFCSHLTHGHVTLGAILSVRHSYLGLDPAHGLRVLVRRPGTSQWQLLGTPSAWRVGLDHCTWWYGLADDCLEVRTDVPAAGSAVTVTVRSLDGVPYQILAALNVCWNDPSQPLGPVETDDHSAVVRPDAQVSLGDAAGPDPRLHLDWSAGSVRVGDDGPLFRDGQSRQQPWLSLTVDATTEWTLMLTPALLDPPRPSSGVEASRPSSGVEASGSRTARGSSPRPPDDLWTALSRAVTVDAPDTEPGAEVAAIGAVLPWFAHDAVIHYLSPRGLEQYSGGGWGTRDISQGPVGLLSSLGAHADLRHVVELIMRAQNARGDWPQAFQFLERHRHGGQGDAHGDVVHWPIGVLAHYLAVSGDHEILHEQIPFTGDDGATEPASVLQHVQAAVDHIETTLIPGTGLPAYGHGDWNDSLQPADPELARRMTSTWTAILLVQSLGDLADQLADGAVGATSTEQRAAADVSALAERCRGLGDRCRNDLRRLLLIDGVLTGYAVFADGAAPEPMIHPSDRRTGLRYSLLPMIHAISADLLTPDEARHHLGLIEQHLLGRDGARLFDRPIHYRGGPMTTFQRAEASTFFGREIGLMYVHAHLRYAEALARVGDGSGLLRALAQAHPIGITDRVVGSRPRQSTCYYSSSDASFADRTAADDRYHDVATGDVDFEGGWRVYSSGPGLFWQLFVQRLLGIRVRGDRVEIDPVLDPGLDGLAVEVPVAGQQVRFRFRVARAGHGITAVTVPGGGSGSASALPTQPLTNPYRTPGVSVDLAELHAASGGTSVDVETG